MSSFHLKFHPATAADTSETRDAQHAAARKPVFRWNKVLCYSTPHTATRIFISIVTQPARQCSTAIAFLEFPHNVPRQAHDFHSANSSRSQKRRLRRALLSTSLIRCELQATK